MAVSETHLFDEALVMKSAGLIAASAAVATVIDAGPGVGKRYGKVVIDVTALEIASNDEIYDIVVQGSSDSGFGTAGNIVELAQLSLSAKEEKRTDCDRDDGTGRRFLMFSNEDEDGTPLRYIRLYTVVDGTIATGINYSARLHWIDIKA